MDIQRLPTWLCACVRARVLACLRVCVSVCLYVYECVSVTEYINLACWNFNEKIVKVDFEEKIFKKKPVKKQLFLQKTNYFFI